MRKIKLTLKNKIIQASLNIDNIIGKSIYNMLPMTSKINTWGDELYFPLNLNKKLDIPVTVVNPGDIAYSKTWDTLCIFYGRTPISNGDEIIPNGPVEVIGCLDEDSIILKRLLSGFFREKRRRISNRVSALKQFAETIRLEQS